MPWTTRRRTSMIAAGLALLMAMLAARPAAAQPNDLCANAFDVGLGTYPFTIGSNDVLDPLTPICAIVVFTRDVFYRFTPGVSGTYRFSTCGSNLNTFVALFSSCNGTQLACNNAGGFCGSANGGASTINLIQGQSVIIRILGGFQPSSGNLVVARVDTSGDFCSNAPTVNEGAFPINTTGLTSDGDTFTTACGGSGGNLSPSGWFRYIPTGTDFVTIDTCESLLGDSVLAIFDRCASNMQSIACNDNGGCPSSATSSRLTTFATAGTSIWIRISSSVTNGIYSGLLRITPASSQPNDRCEDATNVGEGTFFYSTNFAQFEVPGGPCLPPGPTKDVYFRYTPTQSGLARFSTCGSSGDTTLTIRASCGGAVLACNDDFCGTQSQVDLPVVQGVPVLVRVANAASGAGVVIGGNLAISLTPFVCDSLDFNNDTFTPDSGDLDDLLAVLGGGPSACSTFPVPGCNDIDFNNDGLFPDSLDLEAFLSRLAGGPCVR